MCIRPACVFQAALISAAIALYSVSVDRADAQEAPAASILSSGDAVITGFSGVTPPALPLPPGANPLDETFINLDGPSMQIQHLQPNGPPAGQLIPSPTTFTAHARDVGQVFAIALDDAPAPNIYLGATSVFGLEIITPDADADGRPERVKTGQAGAQFMAGQWGNGGAAGSIYRVDGASGAISLFTTIGANAGPGLGDIVYDRATRQFFVSDLDTGLIYRLDAGGAIIDTFDHGVAGRPTHGQAAVADDVSAMDIANPAFNSEDPASWGYTPRERMVWGMAMHGGRLYYAVADGPQVWSVGINLEGTFAADARWELDVTGLASANPVSDIAFDNEGRMILAQRGVQRGSYDYSVFAEPLMSSVVRYTREVPDDPATPGTWVPAPEDYAIGFRPEGRNTDGGIALGFGYDSTGQVRPNSCGEFLWTTGESLRDNPALAAQLAAGGAATVDGLQGNEHNLVRPANDPPFSAYFTDYDGAFDHPEHQGWMGDVEIWQICQGAPGAPQGYGPFIPPYYHPPPGYAPPPGFNLTLDKEAEPHVCVAGGLGWLCSYTVRVINTGTTPYWGPVTVHDWLPGAPPGAVVTLGPQPPWICGAVGPSDFQCDYPPVVLFPGESVDLYVTVDLPVADQLCFLENAAQIMWPLGHGDANPGDDIDFASAQILDAACIPHGDTTNLRIEKKSMEDVCPLQAGVWYCHFEITVTNVGPGVYIGPIQVTDTLSVLDPIHPGPPDWTCAPPAGGTYTCDHAPVSLNPGEQISFWINVFPSVADQVAAGSCTVQNEVHITQAPGGSGQNTDPADDTANAEALTPGPNCEPLGGHSDLSITKHAGSCAAIAWASGPAGIPCTFLVTVTNEGPDPFTGPLTIHEVPTPVPAPPPHLGGMLWMCAAAGGGYDCTPDPSLLPIAPGDSITLPVSVFVPADSHVCSVENTATIVLPAGGSNANASPANDSAGPVTVFVGGPFCAVPLALPATAAANLAITKTADGQCQLGLGDEWACAWAVEVKNVGPGEAHGPITVADVVPNGLAATITSGVLHTCSGAGPAYTCVFDTDLNSGSDFQFHVYVQVPKSYIHASVPGAPEAENRCHVPNQVTITGPLGLPNNGEPGDDHAEATAHIGQLPGPLPPHGGAQLVPCDPPSLKIEKVADPDLCTVAGTNVECSFSITLTSTGPDPYHGTLELDETLPTGATLKSASPPWTCSGASPTLHCASPPVDLAVGESRQLKVTITLPQAFAKRQQCAIVDTAQATVSAAALGSKIGAQYRATATARVPSEVCAPPPAACPVAQRMPNGGCCAEGQKWNGRICAGQPPAIECTGGAVRDNQCSCPPGSERTQTATNVFRCQPVTPTPTLTCTGGVVRNGQCICRAGSERRQIATNVFRCQPVPPTLTCTGGVVRNGQCICRAGSERRQIATNVFRCEPVTPTLTCTGGVVQNGQCICRAGSERRQIATNVFRCEPVTPTLTCTGGVVRNGQCICRAGSERRQIATNVFRCGPVTPTLTCTGGVVRNGQCICPTGSTRRQTATNAFVCQIRQLPASITCRGGSVQNGTCVCPSGTKLTRIATNALRCVKVTTPSVSITCSGGRVVRGVCFCPKGAERTQIATNSFRCVKAR